MLKLFKVLQFIFIFSKYFNQFNFELNRILNGLVRFKLLMKYFLTQQQHYMKNLIILYK